MGYNSVQWNLLLYILSAAAHIFRRKYSGEIVQTNSDSALTEF